MRDPDVRATSYLTLPPGATVVDRFGQRIGPVKRVLLHDGGSFDGIIVGTRVGRRFVDAPEIRRISPGGVTLGIAASDVECPVTDSPTSRDGVPGARWDRIAVTEADRDAVINSLKTAFIGDELTADELAQRVEIAHVAETLEQLDTALADLTLG